MSGKHIPPFGPTTASDLSAIFVLCLGTWNWMTTDDCKRRGGILLCSCRFAVGLSVSLSVGLSVGRSIGPSTRWLSDDNSRTLGPRIMKLHR
ncbi:hypothetical protein DPMN_186371 [Dreissena polymorpha]|uniref:Uncharacterized protein n=1 Tax=Dreissena polymorpha TaxID=45954 RepID=A0A9D4DM54_DREPO|nr:hypothetical protein DPMN_186371 [Dreissena polymorpha]